MKRSRAMDIRRRTTKLGKVFGLAAVVLASACGSALPRASEPSRSRPAFNPQVAVSPTPAIGPDPREVFPPSGVRVVAQSKQPVGIHLSGYHRSWFLVVTRSGTSEACVPWIWRYHDGQWALNRSLSDRFPALRSDAGKLLDLAELVESDDGTVWASVAYDSHISDRTYFEVYRKRSSNDWERVLEASKRGAGLGPMAPHNRQLLISLEWPVADGVQKSKFLLLGTATHKLLWPRSLPDASLVRSSWLGLGAKGEVVALLEAPTEGAILLVRYASWNAKPHVHRLTRVEASDRLEWVESSGANQLTLWIGHGISDNKHCVELNWNGVMWEEHDRDDSIPVGPSRRLEQDSRWTTLEEAYVPGLGPLTVGMRDGRALVIASGPSTGEVIGLDEGEPPLEQRSVRGVPPVDPLREPEKPSEIDLFR